MAALPPVFPKQDDDVHALDSDELHGMMDDVVGFNGILMRDDIRKVMMSTNISYRGRATGFEEINPPPFPKVKKSQWGLGGLAHFDEELGWKEQSPPSVDRLHRRSNKTFYIVNLDTGNPKSTHGGTHWLALSVSPLNIIWFDSFGMQPVQELYDDDVLQGRTLWYSDVQYQPNESVACGYYACSTIIKWSDGESSLEIMKPFKPRPCAYNDGVVMKFLKKQMRLPRLSP